MSQSGLHSVKKSARTKEEIDLDAERSRRFEGLMAKLEQDPSLEIIQAILEMNPEYYTMWNRRRKLLRLDPSKIPGELPLVDKLLKINPKSYWIWNHRRWILENSAEPMWEREVKLLEMMLDLDPRNFHGWDYRRYVMERSGISSAMQEFDYTTGKIEVFNYDLTQQNFSNFSAWHYRSKLLTKSFVEKRDLDSQIEKDLEFVRNAIFTEPADQSAWLYQRYLLGEDIKSVELLSAFYGFNGKQEILVLHFNQKVKYLPSGVFSDIHVIQANQNNGGLVFEKGLFHGNLLGLVSGEISITIPSKHSINDIFVLATFSQSSGDTPIPELPIQADAVWIQELEHIEELAQVEPDSKWVLLTLLEFYQHLKKDTNIILDLLEKLIKIDPFRLGYYMDMKSDFRLQHKLSNIDMNVKVVDLSGLELTRLQPHLALVMAKEINLSNNSLSSIDFTNFISAKKLNLDNNNLSNLDGIESLQSLQHLSLQDNVESLRGNGHIKLEMIGKRAELTKLQSAYPLKLLSPKTFNDSQKVVYILSFGGGMLSNDSIDLTVELGQDTTLTLLSQASNKIFKRKQEGHQALQRMTIYVGLNAFLALLPEPVTCFKDASYKQTQDFYLEETSSLLLLDWMTAGRSSRGESWEFYSFQSTSRIFINNELFIRDAWLLKSYDNDVLLDRMRGYDCVANLIVIGPKLIQVQENLLEFNQSHKIQKGIGVQDLVWSISKMQRKNSSQCAVVMRILARDTIKMRQFILDKISTIDDHLGNYFSRI